MRKWGVALMRGMLGLSVLLSVTACTVKPAQDVTREQAAAVAYQAPGGPTLTVFTMVNNATGAGAHTALMVNGSERVIFDPAGSFKSDSVPEIGDVLYGVRPAVLQAYKSAHARNTYHVVSQEIPVSAAQAAQAMALVTQNGRVADARCTQSTTAILAQVSGFEDIRQTWFPGNLMKQIAARPDVVTDAYYENDAGDVIDALDRLNL